MVTFVVGYHDNEDMLKTQTLINLRCPFSAIYNIVRRVKGRQTTMLRDTATMRNGPQQTETTLHKQCQIKYATVVW